MGGVYALLLVLSLLRHPMCLLFPPQLPEIIKISNLYHIPGMCLIGLGGAPVEYQQKLLCHLCGPPDVVFHKIIFL